MPTVAHLVENIVEKKPIVEEALSRGLINYAALAEDIKPQIEKELKKKIDNAAVVMALRRLCEKLEERGVSGSNVRFDDSDITIKSDLFEFTVLKTHNIIENVRKLYDLMDFSRGDFLTINHGIHEVTVITNRKYKNKIQSIFSNLKVIKLIDNLSSLTVKIPKDAVETVGLFYVVTRALNWENINIIEIVSTLTEMTFILREDDVGRAFSTIKKLIEEQNKN